MIKQSVASLKQSEEDKEAHFYGGKKDIADFMEQFCKHSEATLKYNFEVVYVP